MGENLEDGAAEAGRRAVGRWVSSVDRRRRPLRRHPEIGKRHGFRETGAASGFLTALTGIAPKSSGSSLRPPGIGGTTTSRRAVASTSWPMPDR